MNILKKELRNGLKAFIGWLMAIVFMDFLQIFEYSSMDAAGSEGISALIERFPRVVLAVFGMVDINIGTFEGYYGIIAYYVMICTCIYAIHLGSSAISRETSDKTADFLFTKPRSRFYIDGVKLGAGMIYLVLYNAAAIGFSLLSIEIQNMDRITKEVIFFTLASFFISMIYFALGAFFAAIMKKPSKGSLVANLIFWAAFILAIIYDMMENGAFLRFFTPLKYFPAGEILDFSLNIGYIIFSVGAALALIYCALTLHNKRDLTS